MKDPQRYSKTTAAVSALALAAFALEAALVLAASPEQLLAYANSDDMYYYLVIARRLSAGQGVTFDGIHPTNGFHPLYLALLTPLAGLLSPVALAKAALLTLLAAGNAVGVALAALMRGSGPALVAALWILAPGPLWVALLGVEVPIAALAWVLALCALDNTRRLGGSLLLPAILAGLAVWARTDGLMLVGGIGLAEILRGRIKGAALFGAVVVLITAPWFLWNLARFGSIMQVSGDVGFRIVHGYGPLDPWDLLAGAPRSVASGAGQLVRISGPWVLVVLCLAWDGRTRLDHKALRAALSRSDAALIALAAHASWYLLWQQHLQAWYFLPMAAPVLVTSALLADALWPALDGTARRVWPAIGALLCAVAHGAMLAVGANGYVGMDQAWPLSSWVDENLPPEARIGSINSGALAYWTGRVVVNLDGVVNNDVHAYNLSVGDSSLEHQMPYIRRQGLEYLADLRDLSTLTPEREALLGLQRLAGEGPWRVYRVLPQ